MKRNNIKPELESADTAGRPLVRLLEILFVVGVILLVVAIALPNMHGSHNHSLQAEVKQNLHAIQLVLERYATDNDGNYPYFLYGGDSDFNIGSINGVSTQHVWRPYESGKIIQPFDNYWHDSDDWGYSDTSWQDLVEGRAGQGFGDVLQSEGYLPRYPRNPFQLRSAGMVYGLEALGTKYTDHAGFGGRDGRQMWNNAWFGEAPQLMFFSSPDLEPVHIEYPGSFSYMPRWSDAVTKTAHLHHQINESGSGTIMRPEMVPPPANWNAEEILSLGLSGYDLLGYGSERSKGQDLDDSILDSNGMHYWRTGYLTLGQERNPWVESGLWGGQTQVDDYDERPFSDGVQDFIIIHLGSGMDSKIDDANGQ